MQMLLLSIDVHYSAQHIQLIPLETEEGTVRDVHVANVFNRQESSNDRRVFGPKAHSSVPLAHYT